MLPSYYWLTFSARRVRDHGHDLTKSRAPRTFINMVATNHALVEKHGVIPYVGSLTSRTSTRVRLRNRWAESKLRSLLSAHHLIGAYFFTSEDDKRMRLLTRLYGIHKVSWSGNETKLVD